MVLDYGSGNLRSAQRALQRVGADVEVTADADAATAADGLVVPGVGAFEACMTGLREIGGDKIIAERLAAGAPVLGVCVGMQILFARGVEFGVETAGLRPVARRRRPTGRTGDPAHGLERRRRAAPAARCSRGSTPTPGSTSCTPTPRSSGRAIRDALLTWATHHVPFLAAVEDGPLSATQFHPEKSGDAGAALLANWVRRLYG